MTIKFERRSEMGYFDQPDNVQDYIKMVDGYDGKDLIQNLDIYLEPSSSLLEIGMGPGNDLDILNKKYNVTGSDSSDVFLNLYQEKNPDADLINLDALSLKTGRKFNCIYSNKVLHHLHREDMQKSLVRQLDLLEDNGIALHTFWEGEGEEIHHGLLFVYYSLEEIKKMIPDGYKELQLGLYKEDENDDSILLIIQKI